MRRDTERGPLFRPIVPHQHSRVTYAELLFDLVFVFAVTQVSHTLLAHFTPLGAMQTTLLLLSVWCVWVYTSWVTNWLNPELTPVRVLLFLLMLGGLVLSTSIPQAFESRGLWFAIAYAAMQVGRTVFWLLSTPHARTMARMNTVRILVWLSVSAVFWIAGGLAQGDARLAFWVLALSIEYVSPVVRFWIPIYGASSVADWYVEGGHMAERCAGFIIIALGESIVVTGATLADLNWTADVIAAFLSAFVGALAMWWIYFHKGAGAGSELISNSPEPGRLARLAYTYLHLPIVAGVILSAVANDVVLKHPAGHASLRTVLSAIGGPMLFLIGTILFKHAIRGWLQLSHGIGIILLAVLWWFAGDFTPLELSLLTTAILIVVATWESISLRSEARAGKTQSDATSA
jgi:low temperature requirement protein LtrA